VRFPTVGHEILAFLLSKRDGDSGTEFNFPSTYHDSTIVPGGSGDIHYNIGTGFKSPDASLYEVKPGDANAVDNSTPTIVFEVAYTQSSRKLAIEAARHICLSFGRVLLVVAIDITHRSSDSRSPRRHLQSVTWSHWEEDIGSREDNISAEDTRDVNVIHPEGVVNPHLAFSAVMSDLNPGGRKCFIRVTRTKTWTVCYLSTVYQILINVYPSCIPPQRYPRLIFTITSSFETPLLKTRMPSRLVSKYPMW
jgi:hypothetical protein